MIIHSFLCLKYFYDAGHLEQDQYDAFVKYDDLLDDVFVAIVDDWNCCNSPQVAKGTNDAFRDLGYIVHYGEVLGGGITLNAPDNPWHNGLYVAVVERPRK